MYHQGLSASLKEQSQNITCCTDLKTFHPEAPFEQMRRFEEKFYNEFFKFFFEQHGLPIHFPPSQFMMVFCRGEQMNLFEVLTMDLKYDEITSRKYYQFQTSLGQFEEVPESTFEDEGFKKLGGDAVKSFKCMTHNKAYRISLFQRDPTKDEVAVCHKRLKVEEEEEK